MRNNARCIDYATSNNLSVRATLLLHHPQPGADDHRIAENLIDRTRVSKLANPRKTKEDSLFRPLPGSLRLRVRRLEPLTKPMHPSRNGICGFSARQTPNLHRSSPPHPFSWEHSDFLVSIGITRNTVFRERRKRVGFLCRPNRNLSNDEIGLRAADRSSSPFCVATTVYPCESGVVLDKRVCRAK